ncbi:MAG: PAS domain-containing protein [Desulfatitalea sp.]|nr:PAS domain-containing protein [Desulfatitalea sp.]NNK01349.1 PAS domain-containing protein [Desulfatitalea sp.]
MNIIIVGCGDRCVRLMEIFERHTFQKIKPNIVAVADIDPNAPGYRLARQKGLLTARDYTLLLNQSGIDLIIELTGDDDVFNDLLRRKKSSVRLISSQTVQLFWEVSYVAELHQKARQELLSARTKYKMILDELIQEEVMVINHDYTIAEINRHLLNKLGLTRDEVIGRRCFEITHHGDTPCTGDRHPCPLIKTLSTGKPNQTTHVHLDKHKRELFYSISTYPLVENGEVTGAIEIARDITRDINVQKTLMQQEKLASIGRLSAGVAHEINNPLTTILTSAMLVREELDPADPNAEELDIIANETLRCRKIVTSLLDFARQNQPRKAIANINTIITEGVLLTQKQAAFKDITVQTKLAPQIPDQMLDKGQIEQALINLILNAVEATPEDGTISISSAYVEEKSVVHIEICDTGEGIAPDHLGQIFEPFFTTKESGTGLGLSITHGIVEQHNGTIDARSSLGKGTCFHIYLPVGKGTEDEAAGPNSRGG